MKGGHRRMFAPSASANAPCAYLFTYSTYPLTYLPTYPPTYLPTHLQVVCALCLPERPLRLKVLLEVTKGLLHLAHLHAYGGHGICMGYMHGVYACGYQRPAPSRSAEGVHMGMWAYGHMGIWACGHMGIWALRKACSISLT